MPSVATKMKDADRLPPLVVLLGPTAVGKTKASIPLALRAGGEIVSADSRLLYRGMDIGTAKPTRDERALVPHHLVDVAEVDEIWGLAVFRRAAFDAIEGIVRRRRLPILVGGTGQYVTAILEGWEPPALPADAGLRRRLEAIAAEEGPEALHRRLARLDPASAERIDARNVRRVVRALEIAEATGLPASAQRRRHPPPYRILRLGLALPRAELYQRIDARIDAMLAAGWLEEVRGLLDRGYSPDLPSFSAIGYRQLAQVARGVLPVEIAVQSIRRATRQFVRRQANWFKPNDPRIRWLQAEEHVAEEMEPLVRRWLEEG
jgi:tRNA dimethylallyltransferase